MRDVHILGLRCANADLGQCSVLDGLWEKSPSSLEKLRRLVAHPGQHLDFIELILNFSNTGF